MAYNVQGLASVPVSAIGQPIVAMKINRITKARIIFCSRHFANAMLAAVLLISLHSILNCSKVLLEALPGARPL
jgi:hypothetical protein